MWGHKSKAFDLDQRWSKNTVYLHAWRQGLGAGFVTVISHRWTRSLSCHWCPSGV